MSVSINNQVRHERTNAFHPHLTVGLASTRDEVRASQRLRYQVFAEEQGAVLDSAATGMDSDHYDDYCHHLLVRRADTGEVVGSTRILSTAHARSAGSFYSENEFDLRGLFPLPGKAIEIGRTCIHRDFRNGAGIGMLWAGLARFVEAHQVDFLFGCASISMSDGGAQAAAAMNMIRERHLAPAHWRVHPHLHLLPGTPAERLQLPPLLKAYLRLGAWVAGEPCLDPDFNVADVFILLDMKNLDERYHRHFIQAGLQRKPDTDGQGVARYANAGDCHQTVKQSV